MNWQDIENDREKYSAYLCSREWAEKREAVRERADNRCERCLIGPMDACHHLTYERKYNELLEDLQAICTPCHKFTHGKSDRDPRLTPIAPHFEICTEEASLVGMPKITCPVCKSGYVYLVNEHIQKGEYQYPKIFSFYLCCENDHTFHLCFMDDYAAGNFLVFTGRLGKCE